MVVPCMDIQELYTTAELAQLELTENELERLNSEISQILSYFSKMSELDVDNLEPTTHALLRQNRTRQDRENSEKLSELENNFITIPRVI